MKVLLINISLRPESEKILFPIGLGYVATAIDSSGYDLDILDLDANALSDEQLEERLSGKDFDVVAMGCIVTGYRYVKKLCGLIKKRGDAPIIVGNSVATSVPETLIEKTDADIGVIGEGDITIVELLDAIANNRDIEGVKGIFFRKNERIIYTEKRPIIPNLDSLPMINYDLFNMEIYLKRCRHNITEPYPIPFDRIVAFPINTARGCPHRCTFCYHVFLGEKFRARSVEHLAKEMSYMRERYGVNYFQFFDELTLSSKKRANEIADYFIDNNMEIFWNANCRGGLFGKNDLDLARKLKKAGCVSLGYSLESADEEILKAMDKRMSVEQFTAQTEVLLKSGIIPVTSLVIGYPQETPETIKKTFDACYEANIYPSAGFLLPQPGTPIYDFAVKTGKIKDEEEYLLRMGDRQDLRINLTKMSDSVIESLTKEHLQRISDKLKLGLNGENLIKTGHYRQKKTE